MIYQKVADYINALREQGKSPMDISKIFKSSHLPSIFDDDEEFIVKRHAQIFLTHLLLTEQENSHKEINSINADSGMFGWA